MQWNIFLSTLSLNLLYQPPRNAYYENFSIAANNFMERVRICSNNVCCCFPFCLGHACCISFDLLTIFYILDYILDHVLYFLVLDLFDLFSWFKFWICFCALYWYNIILTTPKYVQSLTVNPPSLGLGRIANQ